MDLPFAHNPLPPALDAPHCWCCASLLTTKGDCPICDMAGMMSPPHICLRSGRIIEDEDGCEAPFTATGPDHETAARGVDPA